MATIIVAPDSSLGDPSRASTSDELARWVKDQRNQLTAARDAEALEKLAQGHTDAFLTYARQRVSMAADVEEAKYWQRLLVQATQKLEDDIIQSRLEAGEVDLEEVKAHIERRLEGVPSGSSKRATYLKDLGNVRQAIAARDFQREVQEAQLAYLRADDPVKAKKDYRDAILGFLSRAKDPDAQQTLITQVTKLGQEIEKDRILAVSREVNAKITEYYAKPQGKFAEVMGYLVNKARDAQSVEEANRFRDVAIRIETHHRTLQRAALAAASASGSAKAIEAAYADESEATTSAQEQIVSENRANRPPDDVDWAVYDVAVGELIASMNAAITAKGTSPAVAASILKKRRALEGKRDVLRNASVADLVADVNKKIAAYRKEMEVVRKGDGDDLEAIEQLREAALATVAEALKMPYLKDENGKPVAAVEELERNIKGGILKDREADVARFEGMLAGTVEIEGAKGAEGKLQTQYRNYTESFASAYEDAWRRKDRNKSPQIPDPKGYIDFVRAVESYKGVAGPETDDAGNDYPDSGDLNALRLYLFGSGSEVASKVLEQGAIAKFDAAKAEQAYQAASDYAKVMSEAEERAVGALAKLGKGRAKAEPTSADEIGADFEQLWRSSGKDAGEEASRRALFGPESAARQRPTPSGKEFELGQRGFGGGGAGPVQSLPGDEVAIPVSGEGGGMPEAPAPPAATPSSDWDIVVGDDRPGGKAYLSHVLAGDFLSQPSEFTFDSYEIPELFEDVAFLPDTIRLTESELDFPLPPTAREEDFPPPPSGGYMRDAHDRIPPPPNIGGAISGVGGGGQPVIAS